MILEKIAEQSPDWLKNYFKMIAGNDKAKLDVLMKALRKKAAQEQINSPRLYVHERMYAHLKESEYFDEVRYGPQLVLEPNKDFPQRTMREIQAIIGHPFMGKRDFMIVKSEKL